MIRLWLWLRWAGQWWIRGAVLAFGWWASCVVFWGGLELVSSQFTHDGALYDPVADVADRLIAVGQWFRPGTRLLLLLIPVQFALFAAWFGRGVFRHIEEGQF